MELGEAFGSLVRDSEAVDLPNRGKFLGAMAVEVIEENAVRDKFRD